MAISDRQAKEQKLLLMQELAERRASDPLWTWTPHDKQRIFINAVLRGPTLENWFVAANRSGKSDAGAFCGSTLARYGVDPQHASYAHGGRIEIRDRATSGWVVSLDFPSSRDIIQPKYFDNGFVPPGSPHPPFIPAREIEKDGWRVSDQILKLKNGSIVGFKSADSGRLKFQGAGKDWIHFDEEPPQNIYGESVIRIEGGRRLSIFGTCTLLPPEGQIGGVTWVYTEIIQRCLGGSLPTVGLFGSSIYDNPHLDPAEIARLESKYPDGSVERRIRLGGEWLPGLSGARAYVAFNRQLHIRPLPPLVYRRPLCWAWDFNVSPMVSLIGQKDRHIFRVYREIVLEEGNILVMVDRFRELFPAHGAEVWVYGDATGKNRTSQTGQTSYRVLLNAMSGYPAPLRLKIPVLNPPVPDRINAVNRALYNEFGEVGAEFDESCGELSADFEQVLRDPRSGLKKTSNQKDPYFRRTHTSDAFGYWVAMDAPVTATPPRPTTFGERTAPKMPTYFRGPVAA